MINTAMVLDDYGKMDDRVGVPLLQQVQQALLWLSYTYVHGDARTWPMTPVVMEKDAHLLLIAPMPRRDTGLLRQLMHDLQEQHPGIALMLVGMLPPSDLALWQTFDDLAGVPLVYLDAITRQYHLQVPAENLHQLPDIMRSAMIDWLLLPETARGVAHLDCRELLKQQATRQHSTQDHARFSQLPWLSYSFIAVCVVMFLLTVAHAGAGALLGVMGNEVIRDLGALWGPDVAAGQWWRLLSVALLHGSIIHLGMNMMGVYYCAGPLEAWEGRWRLTVAFLFSTAFASLASMVAMPLDVSVGASGGLFGLLGFMIAILIRHRDALPPGLRGGLYQWLRSVVPINLIISFIPGVNWAAHFGGLLGGLAIGLLISRPPFERTRLAAWEIALLACLLLFTVALGAFAVEMVNTAVRHAAI